MMPNHRSLSRREWLRAAGRCGALAGAAALLVRVAGRGRPSLAADACRDCAQAASCPPIGWRPGAVPAVGWLPPGCPLASAPEKFRHV